MRPFLEVAHRAHGREVKLRDVINELAEQFNLTDEEKTETLPSGRQPILNNRVVSHEYSSKAWSFRVSL